MNDNTKRAEKLLISGGYTVVFCRGEQIITSKERGVKPLLTLVEKRKRLDGFCACDKVVGKAAAMLYALLGVCEVYAPVMSKSAEKTLIENGISAFFDQNPDMIINRDGDGICPMEQAVLEASSPEGALEAIKKRLIELQRNF